MSSSVAVGAKGAATSSARARKARLSAKGTEAQPSSRRGASWEPTKKARDLPKILPLDSVRRLGAKQKGERFWLEPRKLLGGEPA